MFPFTPVSPASLYSLHSHPSSPVEVTSLAYLTARSMTPATSQHLNSASICHGYNTNTCLLSTLISPEFSFLTENMSGASELPRSAVRCPQLDRPAISQLQLAISAASPLPGSRQCSSPGILIAMPEHCNGDPDQCWAFIMQCRLYIVISLLIGRSHKRVTTKKSLYLVHLWICSML